MPFQAGDILAFYGRGAVSRLISLWTTDPLRFQVGPSHVGIVCNYTGPEHTGPLLVESTTLNDRPCLIRKLHVRGVQAHDPAIRINGYNGRVDLYRLVPIWRLDQGESELLTQILVEHFVRKGVAYDTGGALLSGTRVFKLTRLFPAAALNLVFCSELASAVLMRLGRMNVRNPAKYTPGALVRQLVRTGVYERVGNARDMISRAALPQAAATEAA